MASRTRTLTPATAHPEFAKAAARIAMLPAIKGEVLGWAGGDVAGDPEGRLVDGVQLSL